MKIWNCHERTLTASSDQITALIANFDHIWPTQIEPIPQPQGDRLYDAGTMLWEEYDRLGSIRAFRVLRPAQLQAEHWFEVAPAPAGNDRAVLRHIVEGHAVGEKYEALWRERIEPLHDQILEALLDNVQAAFESPRYEPNPKHKEPWQRGARGSLCPKGIDAPALLKASVIDPKHPAKRYATDGNRAYCGQEHRPGRWHGYPVQWREVPAVIRRGWAANGEVGKQGLKEYW